jgi:membrane protein
MVVGLLIWLNLIARLILISAAWAANDLDAIHGGDLYAEMRALSQAPGNLGSPHVGVTDGSPHVGETLGLPGTAAVRAGSLPTFGVRSRDRTAVGSGFILGAVTMASTAALARSIRSMIRLGRG